MKNSALPPIIRDIVLLGLGAAMLAYMTYTGRVNAFLVGAAMACLGLTAGFGIQSLRRDGKPETPSTQDSPSPSHSSLPPTR